MYADDTTLVGKFRDFELCNGHSLSVNINYEITKLTDWLNVNKLSLNKKNEINDIPHTPKKFNMPTIKINNTELEPATHFNYLGITINKHTKWDGHLKKIAIKISKASGIIFKLNDVVLPYNVLITLYNALILPHLTYGVLAWSYENDIIFKLQKRALRAVTSSRYNAHTGPLFIKKIKLLNVKDIHKLSKLNFFINFFIVNCRSISTQCSQGSPLIFMVTRLEKETPF